MPLMRGGAIPVWDDTEIKAGEKWEDKIKEAMDSATVAVLLVSDHYLASDFIVHNELPPLLEAVEEKGLEVLWVAVSHSLVEETEIYKYQCVNDPKKPLDTLSGAEQKRVLANVCRGIKEAAAKKLPLRRALDEELAEIRKRFLVATTVTELKRVLYEAEALLLRHPIHPEIRVLIDQIKVALKKELAHEMEVIRNKYFSTRSSLELEKISNEVERLLSDYPNDPEVRHLKSQIDEAIKREQRIEENPVWLRLLLRHRAMRWTLVILSSALLIYVIAAPASWPERLATYFREKLSPSPTPTTLAEDVQLRIINPSNNETVGAIYKVRGETPYPTWHHYIIVKPLGYSGEGFVEAAPPDVAGSTWSGWVRFGDRNTGRGHRFEIRVLATKATLPSGPLISLPADARTSDPVVVIRQS